MPFTLCHPAIVIPLHRYASRLTSLPALIIGSMAPDFVYFFSLGISGSFSHSLLGILMYCLPVGVLVYIVYYALVRQPFLAWLPSEISARMKWQIQWPLRSTRAVWVVIVSLLIGASMHIVWDAFTHDNTVVVNRIGLLRSLVSVGGYQLPLFKVLQHASSLLGFIVIAIYAYNWLASTEPDAKYPSPLSKTQRLLALAAVGVAAIAGGMLGLLFRRATSVEHGLFNMVVTGMAAAAIAILLLCLGWQVGSFRKAK
jgi:hypothetical protein